MNLIHLILGSTFASTCEMNAKIKGSKLLILDIFSNMSFVDLPDLCLKTVEDFLTTK